MVHRSLYGAVLVLAAGLLAVPAWAPGSRADPPPAAPANSWVPPYLRGASSEEKPPEGPPQSPPVTPVAPAAGTGASVSLEMIEPGPASPGQPLRYELIVRNTAAGGAARVRVEVPLAAGSQVVSTTPAAQTQTDRLSWDLGTLAAGQEQRLTAEVRPGDGGEALRSPNVSFAPAAPGGPSRSAASPPALALDLKGPGSVPVGAPVFFEIHVTNNGTAPVTKPTLWAQIPPGLSHPQGPKLQGKMEDLAPGQTRPLSIRMRAERPGRWALHMTVLADGGARAEKEVAVVVAEPPRPAVPALSVSLQGPRQSLADRDLPFQLTVTNTGSAPASNLRLTQMLPAGLDFVSAGAAGYHDPNTHSISWSLPALAAGQSLAVPFQLRARAPGDWALQATAQSDQASAAPAGHAVHVDGVPTIVLEVTPLKEPLNVGDETTYEVRVLNRGTAPAGNLRLAVRVPEVLTPLHWEGPAAGSPGIGGQVLFAPLPRLEPHSDALYTIHVQGRTPGVGPFLAEATADTLVRPVQEDVAAHVYDPQRAGENNP